MDQKKLKKIEDDLINKTEEFTTEVLERIYITLNECVVQYRNVYDRTQLPSELTDRLTSLKVFWEKNHACPWDTCDFFQDVVLHDHNYAKRKQLYHSLDLEKTYLLRQLK